MSKLKISDGTVISHYRIDSQIGAGGMGEVYKAHDTTLERFVALKVLPPSVLTSSDRVRRFVGEAKSASALNHPHIVTIHEIGQATLAYEGAGEDEKIHYIAMEYIEGTTLRSHIYRDTELKRLVELMAQCADGLAKAHNAGIVHRDLKPDNIMVTTDGYAKIVDFGLAKLTEKESGRDQDVENTEEGMILGTAGYMSPEQVQGKLVDQRSDIFSFGCILFECATKSKPFQSETAIDTMHRIVFGQPHAIGELNPDVPEELARIVRKCLAKDPDERYQSIKEIAVDLRNLSRNWDQQLTVSGRSMSFAPAFPTSTHRTSSPGSQSLEDSQPKPSSIPPAASGPATEIPLPPRHIPIGRWVFRVALLLVVVTVGWLWYAHPDTTRVASGPLESFPTLATSRAAGEVEWSWLARENVAVPVRVAAVAAADPGFMERSVPTVADLKQEGAVSKLFQERRIPGLSPISRAVASNVLLEPGLMNGLQSYVVAFDLERSLPRTRILELYINSIEFQPGLIGVDAAARRYFGKSASSLSESEAALLIASIGSPDADLRQPPDWLIAKRDSLLVEMKER